MPLVFSMLSSGFASSSTKSASLPSAIVPSSCSRLRKRAGLEKNAILLIDFAKWSHKEKGTPLREALIEAGRIRLRPIMMTTIALVAGMIPVAIGYGEGADFRASLGRAVIGGVIASTVLTLVVIPTVYEILEEWREAFLSRFRRSVGVREHSSAAVAPVASVADQRS